MGESFVPKGEPKHLNRGPNSESPGKELSSFTKGLPAQKLSTIRRTGTAKPEQATKRK